MCCFWPFLGFVCLRFRPSIFFLTTHIFLTAMQPLVVGFEECLERANQLAPELHNKDSQDILSKASLLDTFGHFGSEFRFRFCKVVRILKGDLLFLATFWHSFASDSGLQFFS